MDFEEGDVVVLKSGGPNMTIEKIGPRSSANEEKVAHCIWFDTNEQMKEGKFNLSSLMINDTDLQPANYPKTIAINGVIVPLYKEKDEIIQDFVKKILRLLFNHNIIPEKEILNMLDKDYCSETFCIQYPIIQDDKTKLKDKKGHSRYYSNEVIGDKFYVCSQWWRQNEKIYSNKISEWIRKIGKINEAKYTRE